MNTTKEEVQLDTSDIPVKEEIELKTSKAPVQDQEEVAPKGKFRRQRVKARPKKILLLGNQQRKHLSKVAEQKKFDLFSSLECFSRRISDIPHSPRKLRRLRSMLIGLTVDEALAQLTYSPSFAGKDLILSALRDIKHELLKKGYSESLLSNFIVNEGMKRKKLYHRARGSAHIMRRRMSHAEIQYIQVER
jgi:ribosomal protein L22